MKPKPYGETRFVVLSDILDRRMVHYYLQRLLQAWLVADSKDAGRTRFYSAPR